MKEVGTSKAWYVASMELTISFTLMPPQPHEQIVASVIYYYDTDPTIEDAGLSLRRLRKTEDEFPYYLNHEVLYHRRISLVY
jgi:hypothetical protein